MAEEERMIYSETFDKPKTEAVSSNGEAMVYVTDMDNVVVKVPRETDDIFYPSMQGGFENVREAELTGLIYSRIEKAALTGDLQRSLNHSWNFLESNKGNIDSETFEEARSLFDEGRKCRSEEEVKAFLGKLKSFAGSLERTPIRKK